jgi:hypothetical protein
MTPRPDDGTGSFRLAVVVLPGCEAVGAIQGVIRDIAVAADAVRVYGIRLEALLVIPGHDDREAIATKEAATQGLPVTVEVGPSSAGPAYLHGFRRIVADGRASFVVTLDSTGRHDATQLVRLFGRCLSDELDVVIGSQRTTGRLARRVAFHALTGIRGVADPTSSLQVLQLNVVRDFQLVPPPNDSGAIHAGLVARAIVNGYRVGETPMAGRASLPAQPQGRPKKSRHSWSDASACASR